MTARTSTSPPRSPPRSTRPATARGWSASTSTGIRSAVSRTCPPDGTGSSRSGTRAARPSTATSAPSIRGRRCSCRSTRPTGSRTRAVEFVQTAPSSRPFFLLFAPSAPHPPWIPAERHEGDLRGARRRGATERRGCAARRAAVGALAPGGERRAARRVAPGPAAGGRDAARRRRSAARARRGARGSTRRHLHLRALRQRLFVR